MSRSSRRTLVSHKLKPFNTGDAAVDRHLDERLRDHTAQTFEKLRYFDKYTPDHEITKAEADALLTPVAYQYPPGDIRRFGADPTGIVDATTAITNALAANAGSSVHAPGGTYKCTAQIVVPASTLFYGDGMGVTTLAFTNPDGNQFVPAGNKVCIRDLTLSVTGIGVNSNVAGININGADWCQISRVEVIGVAWCGIGIFTTSSHNLVEGCYLHDFQGSLQDSADITLSYQTGSTTYNVIRDNFCLGGIETGILILGNSSIGASPQYNFITGNRIGYHTTYGILDYQVAAAGANGYNQITHNYIENIQGITRPGGGIHGTCYGTLVSGSNIISGVTIPGDLANGQFITCLAGAIPVGTTITAHGGGTLTMSANATATVSVANLLTYFSDSASGAGIYVVTVGGDIIEGNVLRNCCVQTTFRSLVPAGIAINGNVAGLSPVTIANNAIEEMTRWDGIAVAGCVTGATIVGNQIGIPTNTTGDAAINLIGSSNIVCDGNSIDITPVSGTTVAGITVNLTTSQSSVVLSNNRITGGNFRAVSVTAAGAQTLTGFTLSGNIASGSGGGNDVINLTNLIGATITGNYASNTTNKALVVGACTQTRISNNTLLSTGTSAFSSSGTCTGSFFDQSNYWNGTLVNGATGLICEQRAAAVPSTGTAAVGDTWWQTTPVSGASPGGMCTAAGSPGTWKGFGNLA